MSQKIVRHSSPRHSSPQTFITPCCRIRHSSPRTFITSDVHHLRHSSPQTFITSDIFHPLPKIRHHYYPDYQIWATEEIKFNRHLKDNQTLDFTCSHWGSAIIMWPLSPLCQHYSVHPTCPHRKSHIQVLTLVHKFRYKTIEIVFLDHSLECLPLDISLDQCIIAL